MTRVAPLNRRQPVQVAKGQCPVRQSCGCCPGSDGGGHRSNRGDCRLPHPPQDRVCRPPWPKDPPPCPEWGTLPQDGGWQACCIECGRVTARRWTDPNSRVLPWCGGDPPAGADVALTSTASQMTGPGTDERMRTQ